MIAWRRVETFVRRIACLGSLNARMVLHTRANTPVFVSSDQGRRPESGGTLDQRETARHPQAALAALQQDLPHAVWSGHWVRGAGK